MRPSERPPVDLQTDRPHPARVYDVLLGGKTNYAADREAARQTVDSLPNTQAGAVQNRAFMHRVVRFLAAEVGIRQFLDIGTGIPTSPNLHEVAQEVAPESRVVYADNDPIVLTHSRALHSSHPQGRTTYLDADLCRPEDLLAHPDLTDTLDLDRPVALTLLLILHWLPRQYDPYRIVDRLMRALPSGSYLVITHATDDFTPSAFRKVSENFTAKGRDVTPRSRTEVLRYFDGMELLDPGLVVVQRWRPDPADTDTAALGDLDIPIYAGVARKP